MYTTQKNPMAFNLLTALFSFLSILLTSCSDQNAAGNSAETGNPENSVLPAVNPRQMPL